MQSTVLALVLMATCCAHALNIRRQFVRQMVVKEEIEVVEDGQGSFAWKDHALFRYLKANHSPRFSQGVTKGKSNLKSFKWQDCGTSAEIVKIQGLTVTPDPVVLPGGISVKFSATINETVDAPLKMQVELKKHEAFIWITIPCIENLGSCTYDDLCETLMGATCPPEFVKNNIPCKCPFTKGSYSLPTTTFQVDTNQVPSGDYHAQIHLFYGTKPVYCLDAYATIDSN
ncbi:ganglioside GM2 activator [Aplysia californica]|uniref:Ganglioside GM2 activator n=1 Tax=Aplysia californica TaxID=6500 RepID=A0ABM0JN44_APLCA|nr:ganglioside GM2 activator [Aplysia californica]XP_005097573.1 ganglioside GM2 activator [Aplysia californica]